MNLLWIVFIFATAAVGVYLYIYTMHREQLTGQRRRPSGDRVDLRSDGTVVDSSPDVPTPGDIGYVAPPARHYTPLAAAEAEPGGHHHAHEVGGHDAGGLHAAGSGTDGSSFGGDAGGNLGGDGSGGDSGGGGGDGGGGGE